MERLANNAVARFAQELQLIVDKFTWVFAEKSDPAQPYIFGGLGATRYAPDDINGNAVDSSTKFTAAHSWCRRGPEAAEHHEVFWLTWHVGTAHSLTIYHE